MSPRFSGQIRCYDLLLIIATVSYRRGDMWVRSAGRENKDDRDAQIFFSRHNGL